MANARHHLLIVFVFVFVFTKTSYSLTTTTTPSTQEEIVTCGKDAVANKAPFIVAIEQNDSMICVGSILSEHWVLIPGQCIFWDLGNSTLVAGSALSGGDASTTQKRSINYHVVHDLYSRSTKANDIALVYTATPFTWSSAVAAINLPAKDTTPTGNAISYGWDNTDPERIKLQAVTVPIISQDACQSLLKSFVRYKVHETHICTIFTNTTGGGVDNCTTDCRGHLIQQINNQNVLIGISSYGPRICSILDVPNVYVMVSSQISWINDHQVVPSSSDLINV